MARPTQQEAVGPSEPSPLKPSLLAGLPIGIAVMAAVDEIVFHQVLHWHHFYDRSSSDAALVSDGLLHAAELVVIVAGFLYFAELKRRRELESGYAGAGLLLGLGAFQLWDGLIDHKLLDLRQVRYGVDLLPYDLAWNGFGLALLIAGAIVLRAARAEGGEMV